ncbi:helix-turn-helix domain-containing protein [bacterium]|nr:helix-turn-helix domain-containing protein [bacterium]
MNYGDRIRIVREKLKITQKEMAKILGISQAYLCAIESGKMQANAKVIFGLTMKCGVRTLWLSEGIGSVFGSLTNDIPSFACEKGGHYIASFIGEIGSSLDEGKLHLFNVVTDNMEPCFLIGDEVLVDVTDTHLKNLGVYLFEIESKPVLKRFIEGEIGKLTNDKPAKKNNDIFVDSSVKCLGRAVWIIRKL